MKYLHHVRADGLGLRHKVIHIMLRLNLNQETYDFIKWENTCENEHGYDWEDLTLPYLSLKNQPTWENLTEVFRETPV